MITSLGYKVKILTSTMCWIWMMNYVCGMFFWIDGRSRAAYKSFHDVITFDTTYLTNKYDISFAPFIGINHYGESIILGCGLLSGEDTDSLVWVFRQWLQSMCGIASSNVAGH